MFVINAFLLCLQGGRGQSGSSIERSFDAVVALKLSVASEVVTLAPNLHIEIWCNQ